jgi:hypothetical protein
MLVAKGHEKRVQSYNFFTNQTNLSLNFIEKPCKFAKNEGSFPSFVPVFKYVSRLASQFAADCFEGGEADGLQVSDGEIAVDDADREFLGGGKE